MQLELARRPKTERRSGDRHIFLQRQMKPTKSAATARRGHAREEDGGGRWGRGIHCVGRGGGRRRPATATRLIKMKPTLTTSFRYEARARPRGKAGTRAGGGRQGKMGTGCPLRWARRRTAATGDGDTFVQDVTDSDHLFFSFFSV